MQKKKLYKIKLAMKKKKIEKLKKEIMKLESIDLVYKNNTMTECQMMLNRIKK